MIDDLGLSLGEATIVVFVVVVVLSARFWPRLGERIAVKLWGGRPRQRAVKSREVAAQAGATLD
jgi:hypothetical protein